MSRAYPNRPVVGIGVIVLRADAVLLIRRGQPPNDEAWSLPGGGQEVGETMEHAARRELAEETGLTVGPLTLAAVADGIDRDSQGRVRYHYTIIDFAAHWAGGEPRPGGDVREVAWAPFERLGAYGLWAEVHRVIAEARARLGV